MMTGVFQSAKQENTKLFQVSVPDFQYEYKEKEWIAGHEVFHIGEGVYMFRELISLKECKQLKMTEVYPDLKFFACGPDRSVWYGKQKDYKFLLLVVSEKYKRHDEDSINYVLQNEAERFNVRRSCVEAPTENLEGMECKPLEDLMFRDGYYPDRKDYEQGGRKQITGKLGFRYEPDKYKKVNGWDPYFLCKGRIGKYVYPGIYHFEDSLRLPLDVIDDINFRLDDSADKRIFPLLNNSSLGDTWYCCLGVVEWLGGTLRVSQGIRARYICLDRQSAPVLKKISEFLTDYEFGVKRKVEPIEPVSIEDLIDKLRKEPNEEAAEYVIEDNAVELVAGYGFCNLTVLCSLIFGNDLPHSQSYKEYDWAYVLGDDLILVNRWSGRLKVPLKAVSTLKVKMVCDLGAGICENAAVTVLDRRESQEREFLGDEAYEKYIRYYRNNDR